MNILILTIFCDGDAREGFCACAKCIQRMKTDINENFPDSLTYRRIDHSSAHCEEEIVKEYNTEQQAAHPVSLNTLSNLIRTLRL